MQTFRYVPGKGKKDSYQIQVFLQSPTIFFVCSNHYFFVHTKKAFFFLVLHFCWNKKKHQQMKVFLFLVLFFEVIFCQPGFNTTAVWFKTKACKSFLSEKKTPRKKFSSWQTRKARVFLLF